MSGNTAPVKTYTVAVNGIVRTTVGCQSVDIVNTGTGTATILGNQVGSSPAPIPSGYTYTLEFNGSGYDYITINNTGNDAVLGVVEKF